MLNGHGDDIYGYGVEIVSNFSSNVYNKFDLSGLFQYLASHISIIQSYPEPDAYSLAVMLAEANNITIKNICVTNGATEAIYLIAQAFGGCNTAILVPTFSEYEDACRMNNHNLNFVSSLDEVGSDIQMVWFCNPNNPTGKTINKDKVTEFIERHPDTVIVIDQSYEFFTEKIVLSISESVNYKNVILLHSMTKRYAVPGIRLGYFTAHPELLKRMKPYCMPWSVNGLAIEAGKYLLKNDLSQQLNIGSYLLETERLQTGLKEIKNLEVFPTDTHFFLCRLKDGKAADLKRYLIDNYSILIRDAANFRSLNKQYFRIATQSPTENDLLVKAIAEWMQ